MRRAFLLAALAVAACAPALPASTGDGAPPVLGPVTAGPLRADSVYDAATLVAAMRARYPEWYRTLSFAQDTYVREPGGEVREETWREWAAFPGRLRIEMDDPLAGSDVLFARDSTFIYRDGTLAAARPERNALLVWGFDVYTQPPGVTLAVLADMGVDLGAFRTDAWSGRPMYVLGTPTAGEVWVDRETLLFTRLVEPGPGGAVQDVRFLDYEPLAGGWIAPRVEVWVGGERVFWELYRDVRAGVALDPVLFDPRRWAEGVALTN